MKTKEELNALKEEVEEAAGTFRGGAGAGLRRRFFNRR